MGFKEETIVYLFPKKSKRKTTKKSKSSPKRKKQLDLFVVKL